MRHIEWDPDEPGRAHGRWDDEHAAVLQAIESSAAVLCKRWKPAILWLLATGHHRYMQLAARLPRATPKMLTQQLRELERDGLVRREVHTGGARHVEYALTPIGEELRPVIERYEVWGRKYEEFAHARGEQRAHQREHERELRRTTPHRIDVPGAAAAHPPGRATGG